MSHDGVNFLSREEWELLDRLLAKHLGTGGYYDTLEILKDFVKKFVNLKGIEREVERRETLKEIFDLIYALTMWKGKERGSDG